MKCLLIYDIPNDRLRTKVADICLDYGLARIQYSAFFGELSHNRQGEVILKIRRKIGKREANVQLYPVCERDLALRKEIVVLPGAEGRSGKGEKEEAKEGGGRGDGAGSADGH